ATQVDATPDTTGDDLLVTHALGFTFRFPGGVTNTVRACTNGYVWLDGTSTPADFQPTAEKLLGSTGHLARLAPYWTDLECSRNTATHPNSGLHVRTDTSAGVGNAVCYVTWFGCGLFNSIGTAGVGNHAVVDVQCVLHEATGVVEFRYGTMPSHAFGGPGSLVVGWSRGAVGGLPSVDPQSRDLSLETPFSTAPEGTFGNIGQRILATPDAGAEPYGGRAYAGQTLTFQAVNVPAGSVIGVQLLDLAALRPGLNIATIHAPGCVQSLSMGLLVHDVHLFPVGTVTGTAPLSIPAGVEGSEVFAQYAVLDGLLAGPDLVTRMSNAVRIRIGRR
ncbi:MAG: hypothetical protein JNK15_16040, partial [Planctomycetes bacterium]|nr:hypothetical protein [Planctomycetota bacterium]